MSILELLVLILVGFLWGATNPLIKRGSVGFDKIEAATRWKKIWLELKFLTTRWQYTIPFLLNQLGGILFVFALQNSELSMAVPIANSCSFLFTVLMAFLLGEQKPSRNALIGITLISLGISICVIAKM